MLIRLFFIASLIFAPLPSFAQVIVNEIAWMGSASSANYEWIELYNAGSESVELSGWTLDALDGTPSLSFTDKCTQTILPADSFLLLERTSDESVPGISAECIYTGALGNSGELLNLRNALGGIVFTIDASMGWPAGDNTTKETMQRTSSGSWVTATATPKALIVSVDSQGVSEGELLAQNVSVQSPPTTISAFEPKQTITTHIEKRDSFAVAGAETLFEGSVLGLEGKLVENARYLWNFGDGTTREGKRVLHAFSYPGEYVVVLEASSGGYSHSDRMTVQVISADISFKTAGALLDMRIELSNNSSYDLDLSGWILWNGSEQFPFPKNTLILKGKTGIFPLQTFVWKDGSKQNIILLYPNGKPVVVKNYHLQDEAKEAPLQNESKPRVFSPQSSPSLSSVVSSEKKISGVASAPIGEETIASDTSRDFVITQATAGKADTGLFGGVFKWIFVFLSFVAVSFAGLFFVLRGDPSTKKETSLAADEFTIIEEK